MRTPLLFFAVLPLVLIAQESATKVAGVVETMSFHHGLQVNVAVRSFTAEFNKTFFFLHSEPSERDEGIQYMEYGCDGVTSYTFTRQTNTTTINDGEMRIHPRACPPPMTPAILTPWFAFGSAAYFRNGSGDRGVHTLWIPFDNTITKYADKLFLDAQWVFEASQRNSLASYVDFRRGYIEGSLQKRIALPASFADNNTNNLFFVAHWTNFHGVLYPLKFEHDSFVRNEAKGAPELRLKRRGRASTFAVISARTSCIPAMSASVAVVDHRERTVNGNPIEYLSSNRELLTQTELRAKATLQAVPLTQPRGDAYLLFWVLILGVLVFVVRAFRRRHPTPPQR